MKLFTDNPITSIKDDKFGFAPYARILRDTILETEELPFCVGIFGAWGSGKSSFMKMIQELIADQEDVRSIWFNPWKYDKKEDLWNALIQTILYQIAEESIDPKVKTKAKNLALATTWFALKKGVATLTAGVISEESLEKIKEAVSKQDEKHYRHVNYFEEDFTKVVDLFTDGGKLVIFIDDLDRCLPENAITVLESLKLFIGNAKCIFVLGMDHYIVEEGIKSRFSEKLSISGRDYLDKIIQIPFFLPSVSYEKIKASLTRPKTSHPLSEEIWQIIRLGMNGNPRKTKRFVNSFYLLEQILNELGTRSLSSPQAKTDSRRSVSSPLTRGTQNIYLAKLLVFQISFPEFYLHLQLHPGDWEYTEQRLIEEDDATAREAALERNPGLDPFWKNLRLRDFLRNTSRNAELNFPAAPNGQVVSLLLQAISLVLETPDPSTDQKE
jgi:energy-coupling factor transporter ATP-binding protein EcfA2